MQASSMFPGPHFKCLNRFYQSRFLVFPRVPPVINSMEAIYMQRYMVWSVSIAFFLHITMHKSYLKARSLKTQKLRIQYIEVQIKELKTKSR